MEGFLRLRMRPVLRRVLTRSVALVPAIVVAAVGGDAAVGKLLVISQVVLSMQLPFAVFPLVHFTSLRKFTGRFANSVPVSILALLLAVVIALLNGYLLVSAARNPAGLDARRR
jgi:Mn2+/Fe2+ NRAMP family transporter